MAERFAAEPWIRSTRAKRQIFGALFDLDFMYPYGSSPMGLQDFLRHALLLGGSNAHPQDETSMLHEPIEPVSLLATKDASRQQKGDRGGDQSHEHRGYPGRGLAGAGDQHEIRRRTTDYGPDGTRSDGIEHGYI